VSNIPEPAADPPASPRDPNAPQLTPFQDLPRYEAWRPPAAALVSPKVAARLAAENAAKYDNPAHRWNGKNVRRAALYLVVLAGVWAWLFFWLYRNPK
jgi:hypothetical protein